MPELTSEPELARVIVRASNEVSIEWALSEDGPEYFSRSYPSEWANRDYLGRTEFDGVIDDDELESRIDQAIEETREFVGDEFYA